MASVAPATAATVAPATVAPAAKAGAGAGAGNNMPSRSASSGYDPMTAAEKAFRKALEAHAATYFQHSADGTIISEGRVNYYKLPGDICVGQFVKSRMYDVSPHELLGRGSFGAVYKLNFDSESFVLKVIKKDASLDLIQREIEFLIALKGKWFAVQLIAAGIIPGGNSYILYPYVEGDTLANMLLMEGFVIPDGTSLKPTGKIPNAQERKDFLHIYNRLIDATYELHQMGIIHHDIKHENIWITGDGEPFFLDFGLSAHVGARAGLRGTNGFIRMNRYRTEARPITTTDINWYALGKTLQVFNPNTAKRPHHITLQRPGITNNIAKAAVIYRGGSRTQRSLKNQTRRCLRRKESPHK